MKPLLPKSLESQYGDSQDAAPQDGPVDVTDPRAAAPKSFGELKATLRTWLVALKRGPDGQFYAVRPMGMSQVNFEAVLTRLAPALEFHSWAINKWILDTWTAERVVGYLDRNGIPIVVKNGGPVMVKPDTMNKRTWQYHVDVIYPHLKARREAVVNHFQPPQDDARYSEETCVPAGSAFDDRVSVFNAMTAVARWVPGSRVSWYSRYDRSVGNLVEDAKEFPIHATHASVQVSEPMEGAVRDSRCFVAWTPLRGHYPPARWKWPNGKELPEGCLPSPGWIAKTADDIRRERSQWFRENWKTYATFDTGEDE